MEREDAIERLGKFTEEDGISTFGVPTNNPSKYVEDIQKNKEYFSSRKQVSVNYKEFTVRKLYSCFRFRAKCRATLTGRYYPKENIWRMTKSKVHNHGPMAPNPVVKRGRK